MLNLIQSIPLSYYIFSSFINFCTSLGLSFFILIKNPKPRLNRAFSLFALTVAQWSLFVILWEKAGTQQIAGFYLRVCMVGVIFIPPTFTHFVDELLSLKLKPRIIFGNYFISLLILFTLFTPLYAKDEGGFLVFPFWFRPGIIFPLHLLHFFSNVIYTHYKMWRGIKSTTGQLRNQIRYVFIGTSIGYLAGSMYYFCWYRIPLPPFLNILISVYIGTVAYAILKYRLMDIKVAITRTGIFVAVYTLVLGLPFAIATLFKDSLIAILGGNWWMLPLGLMALLATAGPFIYIYINRKAEERLLKEQRRYQMTLKQASVGMTRIRDLRKLLDLITHIVTKTVRISYAAIYLYNQETNEFILQVSRDKGRAAIPKLNFDTPLISWIMVRREPVVYEEVRRQMHDTKDATYKHLEENMRMLGATVIIPSFLEDRFMGFFVLGEKISGQIYTPEDLNVFQVLASQAALAIENAQFYEETKEMQEQIAQAEKMSTIGTMADGLSHQINNRFHALALIAGDTIDTIKITDTSQCTPEVKEMINQINRALGRIQANVMQGAEVVRGILKYTRKGERGFEALTLDQILDGTLEMVQYKVKLSEIDIIRDYPKDTPKLKVNLAQIEEVFFNFIDNAYDAIVERRDTLKEEGYRGRITVSARPKDTNLGIIIEDNGMGIKDKDKEKMFTPFFTTKVSSRRGTGLGLYVIKRIITDTHKGKIGLESEHKVGTRFIVELPTAG